MGCTGVGGLEVCKKHGEASLQTAEDLKMFPILTKALPTGAGWS